MRVSREESMSKFFRWAIVAFLIFSSIITIGSPTITIAAPANQTPNFNRHFQALGVEGSIVIYDANKNRTYQHNPHRNATAFLPASTFKILNSLVALESRVIADENAILTWDGITRSVPEWNRDLTMKEAIKVSAVWFYQVLARRAGHTTMQKWVSQAGYGNQKIGSAIDIDKFWLQGELRITPQEQIKFLQRLANNTLPFAARSTAIVKNILIQEQTPNFILRGKTGTVNFDEANKPQIGWYVGYLEQGKNTYFFATNLEMRTKKDTAARSEITRRCLKDLGLLTTT
jgi:beta-lactamase class D